MSGPMPLTQTDPLTRRLLPLVTVVPYALLAILFLFLVYREIEHGPAGEVAAH